MRRGVPELVRALAEREAASGWAFVRRVPSTYTWKIVDYLRGASESERTALVDAFVSNALFCFDSGRDPGLHAYAAGHVAYRRLHDALPQIWGWEYENVRSLRGILVQTTSTGASPPLANVPAAVLARAAAIRPTRAAEIRKAVKTAFRDRYGSRPENQSGGDWRYPGTHSGRAFDVSVDYGGWDQLRYEVEYEDPDVDITARRLTYEGLVGAGFGRWDSLTADNLEASVDLLCELVERLVELPDTLT